MKKDVSQSILSYLEQNQFQLECLYTFHPLAFFYELPMQPLHMLLGYIERMYVLARLSHQAVAPCSGFLSSQSPSTR